MNSQMRTSNAPVITTRSARPSVLSSIRRHIAALLLIAIFAAGLALALALAVSPLDRGHIYQGPSVTPGVWAR